MKFKVWEESEPDYTFNIEANSVEEAAQEWVLQYETNQELIRKKVSRGTHIMVKPVDHEGKGAFFVHWPGWLIEETLAHIEYKQNKGRTVEPSPKQSG